MVFDLDHAGIAVRDLDRAGAVYRNLGFTLTERSYHMAKAPDGQPVRSGTGNHCFILQRGYVEIIAPTGPGYAGRLLDDLDRYEGLHLVSLGTVSAEAAVQLLSRSCGSPVAARRVTRPFRERGQSFEAAFDIIEPPVGKVAEAHVFAIHHLTPATIWQPHLMAHANGARDLRSVTICTAQPLELAARLAALFEAGDRAGTIDLRAGRIDCVDVAAFKRRFSGVAPSMPWVGALSIGVADVNKTADVLAGNDVPFARKKGRLLVPAASACGVFLEFVEGEPS